MGLHGLLHSELLYDWRFTANQLAIAAGSRQRSYSRIQVPRDSWPYFSVSDLRFLELGGSGPLIYTPQEKGGPVIPPDTGFLFLLLLRLLGLRCRYSNPPPHGVKAGLLQGELYLFILYVTHHIKMTLPAVVYCACVFVSERTCLTSLRLARIRG
jgi:hypothetical protein